MAARARAAWYSLGAATPAKSPSWTTVTPGIASASLESIDSSLAPNAGGQVNQHFSRRGGNLAKLNGHVRRCSAPERSGIERHQLRVSHDQAYGSDGNAQFLRDDLGEGGADVLADFHFAGENGDRVIFA